jgi:hypothetical protein
MERLSQRAVCIFMEIKMNAKSMTDGISKEAPVSLVRPNWVKSSNQNSQANRC